MSKPTHIKEQQGTLKKSRSKTPAVKDNLLPLPPEGFTEFQENVWLSTWGYLSNNGISQSIDLFLIKRYCILISLEKELSKEIPEGGHKDTITNKGGYSYETKSADFKAYMDVLSKIERIEKVIGIGPLWRGGINMNPKTGDDIDDGIK